MVVNQINRSGQEINKLKSLQNMCRNAISIISKSKETPEELVKVIKADEILPLKVVNLFVKLKIAEILPKMEVKLDKLKMKEFDDPSFDPENLKAEILKIFGKR